MGRPSSLGILSRNTAPNSNVATCNAGNSGISCWTHLDFPSRSMKKFVAVLIVIGFGSLVGWLLLSKGKAPNHGLSSRTPPPGPTAASVAALAQSNARVHQSSPVGQVLSPAGQVPKSQNIREAAQASNVPVNFWGKAVDQDDQPLEGVAVNVSVRQW